MPTIKIEQTVYRDKIAKADVRTLQGRWDSKLKNADYRKPNEGSNEEKIKNPEHEITGGFLKSIENLDRQNWWDNLTEENKKEVTSLPNFNNKIFGEITGIEV